MLDDRPYMRQPSFQSQWSMTTIVLAINVAVFIPQMILEFYAGSGDFFRRFLFLSTEGLGRGFIWQLITFQFLHGGVLHLLVNCIVIYFFGRAIEDSLGSNGFLKLYLSSGAIGGLLQMLFAVMFPQYFGGPVVGASAGAFGLVAAFATLYPERPLTLLLFFIIPISMRAKVLLWGALGLSIFGIIVPVGRVAHAAHLGGLLAGIGFIYWLVRGHELGGWNLLSRREQRPRRLVRTASERESFWRRPKKTVEEDLPPAEFISREVDPILEKISAHGIQSLTEREKRILEAAREKMAKR